MLTVNTLAERDLANAALAWLRSSPHLPVQVVDATDVEKAADAVWAVSLAEVCPAPAWRGLGVFEHLAHPITVMAGALLGHPALHILAGAMERSDGYSLALAAARTCPADPTRYAITAITPYTMAAGLAAALQADVLDSDVDHDHCRPTHQSTRIIADLNRAEPRRPRRKTCY